MGPGTAHEECAVAALRMMEAGLREAKPLVRDHTAGGGGGSRARAPSPLSLPVPALATAQGLAVGPDVGPSR